jgi:two-component system sensor histidine kinase YesM
MEAHLRGEEGLAQAVWQLSMLLRNSLEVGSRQIPLSDELNMVRCYLELQKFRYEDRLQYSMEIDPETEQIEIPPLIIQPLVENSIVHGLDRKEGPTLITIRTKFDDQDMLLIEIHDDGAGISPMKMSQLEKQLTGSDESGNRIGLRNVNDRLELTYGTASRLTINSIEKKGTCITFCIPKEGRT